MHKISTSINQNQTSVVEIANNLKTTKTITSENILTHASATESKKLKQHKNQHLQMLINH